MFRHEITPTEVAAFLIEPLQGEGGYYPASHDFIHAIRDLADAHGILMIIYEVQTGFGRTVEWFTSQIYGVQPDVMVMGKAIANGFPLSAVGASMDLLARWHPGSHGTTFGGNPVSCAASAATIEALAEVIPQVPKLSDHAFSRLEELKAKHPTIGDVRGMGLMIGVDLVDSDREPDPAAFEAVARHSLAEGMFILPCGPEVNIIRFIPPLNVSIEDLDTGIDIIDRALDGYEK